MENTQKKQMQQTLEAIGEDLRALRQILIDKYDFEKLGGGLIIACSLPVEGENKCGHIHCVQGKHFQLIHTLEELLDGEAIAPLMAFLKLKKAILGNPDILAASNENKAAKQADENKE